MDRNKVAANDAVETKRRIFRLFLIKPSHYDDDGYVIQWMRSNVPSNSLAALNGIAGECIDDRVLGDEVQIEITIEDEINTRIRPERVARAIRASSDGGLVALVGVQSNQFPRAVDIARPLCAAGIPVCIGGFHVSGCLSMLPGIPPEIQEAMDLGISIFAGEAEGRLGELLQDAQRGSLKPIYDWMKELPSLEGAPIPFLPRKIKNLVLGFYGSQAIEGIHPLQGGFVRLKHRTDRRPGLPIENPLLFYPAYIWETVSKALRFFWLNRTYNRILERVEKRASTASGLNHLKYGV